MAVQPMDISALSRIITNIDTKNGPARAAREVVTGIVRAKDEINIETWEIYDAAAEGAGFTPAGITFKMQSVLHRYLTDVGALIFNVVGAVLTVRMIVEKGIAVLKSVGNALIALLPLPAQVAVRGAYAAAKAMFKDGEVQIMRDEGKDASLLSLPADVIGNVFGEMLSGAMPVGVWSLANKTVSSVSGHVGYQPMPFDPYATAFQTQYQPQAQTGGVFVHPQYQQPQYITTQQQPAPKPPSMLQQVGTQLLTGLANKVIGSIGGLFGDEARDQDVDAIIYQEAVRAGVDPSQLKAAIVSRLHELNRSDARDEDNDDLGYGFTLPDVDGGSR